MGANCIKIIWCFSGVRDLSLAERIPVWDHRITAHPELEEDPQGSFPTAGGRHMLGTRALDTSLERIFQRLNMGFPPLEREFSMAMCVSPFDITLRGDGKAVRKGCSHKDNTKDSTSTIP